MPFIGSAPNKTFQRTDGTRTGTQVWQNADVAGVDIVAPDHDVHDQDLGDAISSLLLRDGGNTASANIPFGGFRPTNLGDALAQNQALTLKQHLNNKGQYCTVGGTANALTLSTGFSAAAYTAGMSLSFIVGTTNTGAVTVNVDSLGVKSLVRADGANTALVPGDLPASALVEIHYDGTRFQLNGTAVSAASGDILSRITPAGSMMFWAGSTIPGGWLSCYGQAVSRTSYPELFAAIGTTHGIGDGSTTFNLPDMRGRGPSGLDNMGGVSADRVTATEADTLGGVVGAETVSILQANLPNYALPNTLDITGKAGVTHNFEPGFLFVNSGSGFSAYRNTTTFSNSDLALSGSITSGGSGTALNKMSPTLFGYWIILANPSAAAAGSLGVHGLQYSWNTATSGDPGAGKLLVNNATLASATALNISETDAYGSDVSALLATLDASTSTVKGYLRLTKVGAPGDFISYTVTGSLTDNDTYDSLTITYVDGNGTFTDGQAVEILFNRTGDVGDTGPSGGGIPWEFSDTTTDSDPGGGNVRANNADLSSATELYVSTDDATETDQSAFLDAMDDSSSTVKGILQIGDAATPGEFAVFQVSAVTSASGYRKLGVTYVSGVTAFANGVTLSATFARTGDKGTTGDAGSNGSDGIDGTDAGIRWAFDSTTTTNADPGSGDLRLNDASFASVTEIAISYACGESGNPDVEDLVKTWDDSTNTANRGTLIIKKLGAAENFATYLITSAITDGTTYGRFTLSYVSSAGSFSNTDVLSVQFARTGDKGADGAGVGDVVGPSSSVDAEIALFDSTTGKLLKRASTTGILKGASGVLSAASAGTDYYAPGSTDVAIADGGTGASNAATAFGNLKQAATTIASGVVELATDGEAQAKSDTGRGLTPSNLAALGASETFAGFVELATDAETQTGSDTARAITPANLTAAAIKQGKHTVWIPSTAMIPRATNGAALNTIELSSNKIMVRTLDFDSSTQEFAQFSIAMPKSWNEGTVTFQPVWSHPSTSTNFGVVWALQGLATSDDDAMDAAFGTEQTSTDTGGTTDDRYIGPESSAITIGGTPAEGDVVVFQIKRVPADASDTLAVDARLHGVKLYMTINAATDA